MDADILVYPESYKAIYIYNKNDSAVQVSFFVFWLKLMTFDYFPKNKQTVPRKLA